MTKADSPHFSTLSARDGAGAPTPEAIQRRRARSFLVALVVSLALHLVLVLWPLRGPGAVQQARPPAVIADLRVPEQADSLPPQPESPVEASAVADPPPPAQKDIAQAPAEPAATVQGSAKEKPSATDHQPAPAPTSLQASASNPDDGAAASGSSAISPPAQPGNLVPPIAGPSPAPAAVDTWTAFMPADNTTAEPTRIDATAAATASDAASAKASSADAPRAQDPANIADDAAAPADATRDRFAPETLAQLQSPVAVDTAPATRATASRPFPGFIVHLRPKSSLLNPFAYATQKELPLRVDLAYKVFLGGNGLLVGDGTYTFEHSGDRYRIVSIAQPRGIASTLIPGRGRAESRGVITSRGLQPQEFSIERGSPDKREIADFDWSKGIVALYGDKTEPFDVETSDPMALLWQFYFIPPARDEFTFSVATTRRVYRYTIRREGREKIAWGNRVIDTEIWRRRSDDGSADVYAWLAPSLHHAPVKLRIVIAPLGVVEALLDTARVQDAPSR
jgi:hypothetical protein